MLKGERPLLSGAGLASDCRGNWRALHGAGWCKGEPFSRSGPSARYRACTADCYQGWRLPGRRPPGRRSPDREVGFVWNGLLAASCTMRKKRLNQVGGELCPLKSPVICLRPKPPRRSASRLGKREFALGPDLAITVRANGTLSRLKGVDRDKAPLCRFKPAGRDERPTILGKAGIGAAQRASPGFRAMAWGRASLAVETATKALGPARPPANSFGHG